ncbi:SDR family oxidoreductase [Massilia sp. H6]|uniref:SDR family NAD(P)-dependent oxidoreductase n=1 Tax=Massilia sp. H6 TaxID=2970464 RepID=UPI0021697D2E|nr:SDR family NAD(P)-dependent oxidoreductase [Massilia sp. H6]UVW30401.1 SDR family NAD(P)-dependent oxidoreductase [Massilia sp. H6]
MIIGGTSGIGLALARHYAEQGAELALCSRDITRIDDHELRTDPHVQTFQFDIADRAALIRALHDFGKGGLDMLIVTAGQYADANDLASESGLGLQVVQTNIVGLVQAFETAAELMQRQGHGHLVAVASVAGLLEEYPGGSLYSASKRAAIGICDAYRKALRPYGIAVTTILPGYVDTAGLRKLNHGNARAKPFLRSEPDAVRRIVHAIEQRAERCIFPWQLHMMVRLFNSLPSSLQRLRRK